MMEKYTGLEIAVIGLSGRFPMADNIKEFWSNVRSGRDCISDFTEQELIDEGISEELVRDPLYVRSNGYTDRKQFLIPGSLITVPTKRP
jgi:acyl transferase domain-containing protein